MLRTFFMLKLIGAVFLAAVALPAVALEFSTTFAPPNGEALYRFTLDDDSEVFLYSTLSDGATCSNTGFGILAADGHTEVVRSASAPCHPDEKRGPWPLKAGTYHFKMWHNADGGRYLARLSTTVSSRANDIESNDTPASALPIITNAAPLTGHLGYYNGSSTDGGDFYRLTLLQNGALRITLNTDASLPSGTRGYTLYASDGTTAIIDPSQITAGTYYIGLYVDTYYAQAYGGYTLEATFTSASPPFPPNPGTVAPYRGLWGHPNESGWGMSIAQQGALNFVALYTYDQANRPTWYVMSSCPILSGESCSGELYKVTGGSSPVVPWNGVDKVVGKAGSGTLTFDDANHGRFSYTLEGVAGSKSIERQFFANGTPAFEIDYTDLWWNPAESGWGVALTQDHGMIFVAWFTYDVYGDSTWYVASACPLSSSTAAGNGCTGDLFQVSGGSPLTANWNGANKTVTQVGSVSFSFSDANNAVMSYRLNGVTGTRNITRNIL
jgi:hypothetical protein